MLALAAHARAHMLHVCIIFILLHFDIYKYIKKTRECVGQKRKENTIEKSGGGGALINIKDKSLPYFFSRNLSEESIVVQISRLQVVVSDEPVPFRMPPKVHVFAGANRSFVAFCRPCLLRQRGELRPCLGA